MADLLRQIINMSLTAGAVILVVLLARALLRRAPRWCSYALWSVVLFRLLCPVSISSALSMLNLARTPVSTGSGPITMVDYAGVIQQSAQAPQQPADLPVAAGSGAVQSAPAGPGWQEVLAWVWVCAAAAMLLKAWYPVLNMDTVIISGIMPLVPGVAITNAIRDTLRGDYISGGARVLEAFVTAAAVAIGAGVGIAAVNVFWQGGGLL